MCARAYLCVCVCVCVGRGAYVQYVHIYTCVRVCARARVCVRPFARVCVCVHKACVRENVNASLFSDSNDN